MKSATQSRSGASGSKSRITRSPGLVACGSAMVVFFTFPRRTPCRPWRRIEASTEQRATSICSRRNASQTFLAPYAQ